MPLMAELVFAQVKLMKDKETEGMHMNIAITSWELLEHIEIAKVRIHVA